VALRGAMMVELVFCVIIDLARSPLRLAEEHEVM
jgi:hypothetical protein